MISKLTSDKWLRIAAERQQLADEVRRIVFAANRYPHGQCWSCGNYGTHLEGCVVFSRDPRRYLKPSFVTLKTVQCLT